MPALPDPPGTRFAAWGGTMLLSLLFVSVLILLAGCASAPPPIVSGDTYCERTRYIKATTDQADTLEGDEKKWRTLVEQIANQNDTYVLNCVIPEIIKE